MSTFGNQPADTSRAQHRRLITLLLLLCPAIVIGLLQYFELSSLFAIVGVACLGLTALIFVKPEATTLIVLFVLYANLTAVAVQVHGVPEPVAASFFLLLGIPLLSYLMIRRQEIITNRVLFLMLIYLGVLLLSATFSQDTAASIDRLSGFLIEGLVLYFLVINTVRTPALLRKAIWTLILAGTLMGSITLYQEVTGSYDNDLWGLAQVKESEIDSGQVDSEGNDVKRRRLAGTLGSKNRYAQVMAVLLPLAIFRLWAERSRMLRLLAAISCIPIWSGVLLTFSRGAGVSLVVALLAMLFLGTIKLRHFVAIGLAGCLITVLAVPDYVYRISTITDLVALVSGDVVNAGGSVRGRATVNLATLDIFLDHPILGVGPGQTSLYTTQYGNEIGFRTLEGNRRAHNMYLEELADTGILGFACFMSIVLITMYQLVQVRRRWMHRRPDFAYTAASFLIAIITYLTTAVFLHLSYVRYYWLLLALAGAAVLVYRSATATGGVLLEQKGAPGVV
jgi:hypothetical protein